MNRSLASATPRVAFDRFASKIALQRVVTLWIKLSCSEDGFGLRGCLETSSLGHFSELTWLSRSHFLGESQASSHAVTVRRRQNL